MIQSSCEWGSHSWSSRQDASESPHYLPGYLVTLSLQCLPTQDNHVSRGKTWPRSSVRGEFLWLGVRMRTPEHSQLGHCRGNASVSYLSTLMLLLKPIWSILVLVLEEEEVSLVENKITQLSHLQVHPPFDGWDHGRHGRAVERHKHRRQDKSQFCFKEFPRTAGSIMT